MIINSEFEPAWWLKNPHGQTVWPYMFKYRQRIETHKERLELPDGDFIDLNWVGHHNQNAPIVLILHGLGGDISSHYAQRIIRTLDMQDWQVVFMHFRGCSGEPNRLPRSYHSGETGDVAFVVRELRKRYPTHPIGVVGYSLGANVLLKWLGEVGALAPVDCAVAVSTPFELEKVAIRLKKGLSSFYQRYLMEKMRRAVRQKKDILVDYIDYQSFEKANDFKSFDNVVTAPLHGFVSAEDYYNRCSCKPFLKDIAVPTLIIHAADDPFMTPNIIPDISDLSGSITLELSEQGGHVGFISGSSPKKPFYWLTKRIPEYLDQTLHGR